MDSFVIRTSSRTAMYDITRRVREIVEKSGIKSGTCTVFVPHTTAGITINENADPDVVSDMLRTVNRIVPFDADYSHGEGNSAAHIKASLFGHSATVIVEHGAPVLGTWQGMYFCEFDGPRDRNVYVKIIKAE